MIVGWDLDAIPQSSVSHVFGSALAHPLPLAVPHDARLGLAINMLEYFSHECRFRGAERAFISRPAILVRQANVEYISTAIEFRVLSTS